MKNIKAFVVKYKVWFILLVLALAIALPFIANPTITRLVTTTCIYIIVCIGLELICGYTGMMCLGFAAFYGVGAYVAAFMATRLGSPFLLCMLMAGLATALVGFICCVPCLRLTVDFVGLITTAWLNIFLAIVRNWRSVTGGPNGISSIPKPAIFGYEFSSRFQLYFLILAFTIIAYILGNNLINSRYGRNLQGIRDNEIGAISVGVKSRQLKLLSFSIGTFFAGIAGCLYAFYISAVSPNNFNFNMSTLFMQMCILGGLGSMPGAIFGAAFLTIVPEMYRFLALYRIGIGGLIMVLLMLFRPQGVLGSRAYAGDRSISDMLARKAKMRKDQKSAKSQA